jgi:hypothetical protein
LGGAIAVGLDIYLLAWARTRLLLNLRETAARRFDLRPADPSTATPSPSAIPQGA